ncbi:TetR/AcrR family transcriptional regulator [Nocardia blacklockiae]|uniref:TetR/AcrR family transcriptional regulator n=1 Tax=Nocardia blacklockiae TaxID=480036 RepID=UPI0018940D91|nr:TetR/AcrR family transcriptional regulator C-terminal domain-containing protein [Nocardia blacklockiae]MBF6173295.1 TetR/AcrR family transcriptional regulator C-terminal domain-containing protein [Nocardia blacklockiae]
MATDTRHGTAAEGIPSVWTRPQRARRETPALSRDQIVAEAIALLDTEGFEALSMRKLGARLGAGATSLYTHVSNKEEILELVVDEVFGEVPAPGVGEPARWRETLLTFGRDVRAVMLRHPWVGVVLSSAGLAFLGPHLMHLTEQVLAVLEAAGFDDDTADRVTNTIFTYILGATSTEAAMLATVARSGLDEQQWMERLLVAYESAAQPYPRNYKRYVEHRGRDSAGYRESTFDEELNLIMDGAEQRRRG